MTQNIMDEATHSRINELCAKGDALVADRQYESALGFYGKALKLVPNPTEEWEATTWILAAIGDVYFMTGNHEKSLGAFKDAVRCPGGLGNPFIHLRLGESAFELGDQDRSVDELTRAYMGAGTEIFANEDPKYLRLLRSRIKPPVGQSGL